MSASRLIGTAAWDEPERADGHSATDPREAEYMVVDTNFASESVEFHVERDGYLVRKTPGGRITVGNR